MTGWRHTISQMTKGKEILFNLYGEARLLYETLGAAQLDWEALQDCFWQQYSNLVIDKNSTSMLGGHFSLMRALIQLIHSYIKSNNLNYGEP